MKKFSVAAAQSGSVKGNISENISAHLNFIDAASEHNVDIIIFPELSLTGYEPEIAKENMLEGSENILNPFIDSANKKNITIIAGAPICSEYDKPYIGAFIIHPSKQITVYRKRYLHKGEELFFVPSQDNLVFRLKDESIGMAICADIDNPAHPLDAKKCGATIYAASVLMSVNGIDDAYNKFSSYAKQYKMLAVMANYAINTGGFITAGKSGIWNENGNLIASAEGTETTLVIAEKDDNSWNGRKIKM
ncbi:MAG: carbon-nitrogen hydrolase family protein [Bacteroidota bacterium]